MAKVGDAYYPEYGRPWWSDGNEPPSELNPNPLPKGYYPVGKDGTVDDTVRLAWVDDAPGDPDDGAGHFEVIPREAGFGYFHRRNDGTEIPADRVVSLQGKVRGRGGIGASLRRAAVKIRYIFGGSK